jgi:hypothetical protein
MTRTNEQRPGWLPEALGGQTMDTGSLSHHECYCKRVAGRPCAPCRARVVAWWLAEDGRASDPGCLEIAADYVRTGEP